MHGALHGTPCALESGRDFHSILGRPRLAGHALLRCRTRVFSSRRTIARPTRETSPSPLDRCAPTACPTESGAFGVVDRSAETAAFAHPVKGERRASIRDVFHRTISPERRFVAEDALDACASFPRPCDHETTHRIPHLAPKDLHRLAPIQIGSYRFVRPTPRSAVTRLAHPCGSTNAVGGPELATWPPRSWARRRFASGVSAPSAIRSMQRSGFPRRCTFRLRRRRSTSTNTPNVGTDSAESSILAHPCRAGARQSRDSPCDEKRNAGALAGHWVLVLHRCRCGANGACATPVPRECEPRS